MGFFSRVYHLCHLTLRRIPHLYKCGMNARPPLIVLLREQSPLSGMYANCYGIHSPLHTGVSGGLLTCTLLSFLIISLLSHRVTLCPLDLPSTLFSVFSTLLHMLHNPVLLFSENRIVLVSLILSENVPLCLTNP